MSTGKIAPGMICRLVGCTGLCSSANNALVQTVEPSHLGAGWWKCEPLQPLKAFTNQRTTECCLVPAGEPVLVHKKRLRPLGDEGPEESDLFGLPRPAEILKGLQAELDAAMQRAWQ